MTVTMSGHDLTQSHDCAAVGCDQEAAVQLGSLWYCRHHAGPIPKGAAPASRNGSTAEDRREVARRLRDQGSTRPEIAAELGVSLSTVGNYLNGTVKPTGGRLSASGPSVKCSGHGETPANDVGPLEQATRRLILLARRMDETKLAFDEASAAWREAVSGLPVDTFAD